MTCQEVDELAAAYALGAMPQAQREEIRRHAAACPEHEGVLARLHSTVGVMDVAARDIEPPARLREQVIQAVIDADRPGHESQPFAPPKSPSRFGGFSLRPAMALPVMALLLVGLLAWNLSLQFGGGEDAFVRYMKNDDDVHGWVYYVEEVGVITVEGLGALPEGQTYQAWAIIDGELHGLGVLPVSPQGDAYILLTQHVSEDEPVFITIESADGAPGPSDRTVLTTEN